MAQGPWPHQTLSHPNLCTHTSCKVEHNQQLHVVQGGWGCAHALGALAAFFAAGFLAAAFLGAAFAALGFLAMVFFTWELEQGGLS